MLKNSSSETVYYLISRDSILKNSNEIANIRPHTYESIIENDSSKVYPNEKEDSAGMFDQQLYPHRVLKNKLAVLLTSQSAEIFADATSLRGVIKSQYNGVAFVFIVKTNDLGRNSDQEILDKKQYTYFSALDEKK